VRNRPSAARLVCLPLAFGLVIPSAARVQETHQHSPDEHAAMQMDADTPADAAPVLPAVNDLVRVEWWADARAIELIIGPVRLDAGSGHLRPPVQLVELPLAGWLHGFEWEMRDQDGDHLPDRLLHHVNVIDPDNRELFSSIPRRIMAAGRETKSERLPGLLGYPIAPGTRVLISAMFAGLPDESFDEAYLHIELPVTPADDHGLLRPRNIYPFYLDVMGPVGEKEFPLPPGTHGRSWEGRPAIGGRLLGIGGHLHNYGDWIRLEDVTAGKVLWEGVPELDDAGVVSGIPTGKLWWRGGVRIRPDHVYRISVQYTNPLTVPAPDGAMGALGGVILADRAEWPEFDRGDADYVEDLRNTLEKPNEAHEHGGM